MRWEQEIVKGSGDVPRKGKEQKQEVYQSEAQSWNWGSRPNLWESEWECTSERWQRRAYAFPDCRATEIRVRKEERTNFSFQPKRWALRLEISTKTAREFSWIKPHASSSKGSNNMPIFWQIGAMFLDFFFFLFSKASQQASQAKQFIHWKWNHWRVSI